MSSAVGSPEWQRRLPGSTSGPRRINSFDPHTHTIVSYLSIINPCAIHGESIMSRSPETLSLCIFDSCLSVNVCEWAQDLSLWDVLRCSKVACVKLECRIRKHIIKFHAGWWCLQELTIQWLQCHDVSDPQLPQECIHAKFALTVTGLLWLLKGPALPNMVEDWTRK